MDLDSRNAELEAFFKKESKNIIVPTININKVDNNNANGNATSNNNNNNNGKNYFESIDISYIDDDPKDDKDNLALTIYDHAIDEIFHPEQGNNHLDEPDAMALQSRIGTPLPPEVDINAYQHKKTLAQGMMDLALLLANANQLRYVLESKSVHPYYVPNIVLLAISITLQIAVGIALIINTQFSVKNDREMLLANRINNFTLIGVFLITIVNVFISAFGIADTSNT